LEPETNSEHLLAAPAQLRPGPCVAGNFNGKCGMRQELPDQTLLRREGAARRRPRFFVGLGRGTSPSTNAHDLDEPHSRELLLPYRECDRVLPNSMVTACALAVRPEVHFYDRRRLRSEVCGRGQSAGEQPRNGQQSPPELLAISLTIPTPTLGAHALTARAGR
jgi:hypothetical protein